ncbi:MAG TPA: TetR/AcrR family transcriptional regulator [Roseiarcus sp.]|nr:TetR/AcrR family transcriptional regulator [Roseiarcus sp.]
MSSTALPAARRTADERRERILEAAEQAFAAHGFHAATMQDVAQAAGMSAGNLYRTFPSKEAIVEGLCARDQQERIDNFAHLADSGSVFAAFGAALRDYIASRSRQKASLIVEIWAEAQRNPAVAAMSRAVDTGVLGQIEGMIEMAKAKGEAAPSVDAASAACFIFTYVGGILKRLALEPDFDAEAEADRALALFRSLCNGALAPPGTEALPAISEFAMKEGWGE